jgi:hypothetical protein
LDRKRQTGSDTATIDMDRAGTALSVVAALLGAGQGEVFAQDVQQGGAWIERKCPFRNFLNRVSRLDSKEEA